MSKIAEIKEKISQAQAKMGEKLDKIPFIKKWREKSSAPAPSVNAAAPAHSSANPSLGEIYRHGGVGTRLQVILVVLFFIGAATSTGYVAKKMLSRFKTSAENESLKKDYAHGFEDMKDRVQANASIISIGEFSAYVYVGNETESMMKLDIWARVSDADAASFAEKHDLILHDKTVEAMSELRTMKVNLLNDEGKKIARLKIKDHLNKAMEKGKIEEIFFHNLLAE